MSYKSIGRWWNDSSIELVDINGKAYALAGWNGEDYNNCWICTGEGYMDSSEETYRIRPIYKQNDEDDFELVGYEVLGLSE